jgi:diguanylate cyclase (GGDEF)-like protein/PAS domain S-box-containing protein
MGRETSHRTSWFDGLTQRLRMSGSDLESGSVADIRTRTSLVAKTRWILLLLIGFYAIFACSLYSASHYGFFLSRAQLSFLILSLLAVICYNTLFQFQFLYNKVASFRFKNRLQIFLDTLFVTILIHFSGGAASWFWPVYLIVTIEAAFIMKRRRNVFIMGGLGSLMYGALLILEHRDILSHADMPFVNSGLHHEPLFQVLIWLWVTILNATVAIISVFLMNVIRQENKDLRASEERLLDFIDSASDLIHSNTPDGRFLYANRSWQKAVGYSREEIADLSLWEIVHPDRRAHCLSEFNRHLAGEQTAVLESDFQARDGRLIPVEGSLTCSFKNGEAAAVWGIFRDISERKEAQEQLFRLAHHDSVTGLPNRTLFNDRLRQARAMARRANMLMAVLFLDLDRFKIINDTLGHPVGDQLLRLVGERLVGCLREIDTIARVGGDEYTIVLVDLREFSAIEHVAQKILAAIKNPFNVDGHELFMTTSIGIAVYPADGEDLDNLVKKADIAMYHAKSAGRNNFQFYSPALDENVARKLKLMNSLQKALDQREFLVYYQPKYDIGTGRITALEALLRWKHPEFGLVYPDDFVPLSEEMGLIIPLGEWVLREACRQNKAWQEQGFPRVRIAVNLSPYQFKHKGLVAMIMGILEETGMEAELLELEITESVIMQNPDMAVETLCAVREQGIHISIDDFGTGYSSLAHLKKFSVNTLKIDKAFVRDVEANSTDAAIATAIIAMGNSLNLRVIAEGVETEGQLTFLRENKCDEAQGFFLSVPLPAELVPGLVSKEGRYSRE